MAVDIDIGVTGANAPAMVDLEELLATRLLVQGNSGSGVPPHSRPAQKPTRNRPRTP